jgi:heme exporter protein A
LTERRLTAENLHVWRGERHVLRGIGFELRAGEVLQLTGPNGAGKTSLLRTLCGLVFPEEGRVLWNGADSRTDRHGFHADLTYLAHDAPLKADLTALENLSYWVGLRRAGAHTEIAQALDTAGVHPQRDRLVRTLSAGQKRRVALAGVLAIAAPLWLLDEPTTNLDADGQALVGRIVDAHVARGGLVVAAVHHPLAVNESRLRRLELPP